MDPTKLTIVVHFTDERNAQAFLNDIGELESANNSAVVNFDYAMDSISDEELNQIRDESEANKKFNQEV
jgi:hypothetical protein